MKNQRILDIYVRLLNNKIVNRKNLAQEFEVSERTIHRDISDLRNFMVNLNMSGEIEYDPKENGYVLKNEDMQKLSNSEILAVCKILLDSRAFLKDEMMGIIDKLLKQCIPHENFKKVSQLIDNEKFHYMELQHKKSFIDWLWDIGDAIKNHNQMEIKYKKMDGTFVTRVVNPVGLMFSEYYFYLLAHIVNIDKEKYFDNKDDVFPTIYRVDRIDSFKILPKHFRVYYKDRFEEGEFRKRTFFMTGGRLQKIKFKYTGHSLEAILDKIPTAEVIEEGDGYYIIKAEVFGNGINRWILSQGKDVEIIK